VAASFLDICREGHSGLVYHHTGLPIAAQHDDERYLPALGAYVGSAETNEFGIQWWRFAANAPVPDLVRNLAHVGFKVGNLSQAILDKDILLGPVELEPGVTVAFIQVDGFPIQLIEAATGVNSFWTRQTAFQYHSIWQPRQTPHEKDVHLEKLKMFAAQPESDYGIGWVRYHSDAPYPDVVKSIAHVVFEVEDIEAAMHGRKVIIPANNPDTGLWVGFVEDDGAPIEFIQVNHPDI
jgi:hypothetical protein